MTRLYLCVCNQFAQCGNGPVARGDPLGGPQGPARCPVRVREIFSLGSRRCQARVCNPAVNRAAQPGRATSRPQSSQLTSRSLVLRLAQVVRSRDWFTDKTRTLDSVMLNVKDDYPQEMVERTPLALVSRAEHNTASAATYRDDSRRRNESNPM